MRHKTNRSLVPLSGLICVIGLFILLGSVGSMELDTISIEQGIVQSLIGYTMFAGGAYWGGFMR